mmetsp:Transcript_6167/g.10527  ORF Transcript_6167/g.10527 Transcript_6167/m.10527 type:complete len:738 (-) Transcript_6167:134-2347(-)
MTAVAGDLRGSSGGADDETKKMEAASFDDDKVSVSAGSSVASAQSGEYHDAVSSDAMLSSSPSTFAKVDDDDEESAAEEKKEEDCVVGDGGLSGGCKREGREDEGGAEEAQEDGAGKVAKGGGADDTQEEAADRPQLSEDEEEGGGGDGDLDSKRTATREAGRKRSEQRSSKEGPTRSSSSRGAQNRRPPTSSATIRPPPSPALLSRRSTSVPFVALKSGLSRKTSPLHLSSWISLALTLDGRDKLTKVVQYSSRLLGWYYESLSQSMFATEGGVDIVGSASYYAKLALGWRALYKHTAESRKAFRLGRGLVEMEKLRGMGWGKFVGYWLRRAMLLDMEEEDAAVGGENERSAEGKDEKLLDRGGRWRPSPGRPRVKAARRASSNVGWGPTTTFGEDDDVDATDDGNKSPPRSISPPRSALANNNEEGRAKNAKIIARPNRPTLPRRVSSNVGWGPLTTPAPPPSVGRASSFRRTASALGRWMYGPQLTSALSERAGDAAGPPPAPMWKLVFSTMKLLGLLGFWCSDNANFLYTSGFLDNYTDSALTQDDRLKLRKSNKGRWAKTAARWYFMAACSGLVVSLTEVLKHRNGKLGECTRKVRELEERRVRAAAAEERRRRRNGSGSRSMEEDEYDNDDEDSWSGNSSDNDDGNDDFDEKELEKAKAELEKAEGRQFTLFLALLKSCCDVLVFSNMPGIDLHKRYRGRKMNEGVHSVCGLVSASTVIYNNFPNRVVAKK